MENIPTSYEDVIDYSGSGWEPKINNRFGYSGSSIDSWNQDSAKICCIELGFKICKCNKCKIKITKKWTTKKSTKKYLGGISTKY